jgi:CTP:molybdopterin cytidylyltransferase MocA
LNATADPIQGALSGAPDKALLVLTPSTVCGRSSIKTALQAAEWLTETELANPLANSLRNLAPAITAAKWLTEAESPNSLGDSLRNLAPATIAAKWLAETEKANPLAF